METKGDDQKATEIPEIEQEKNDTKTPVKEKAEVKTMPKDDGVDEPVEAECNKGVEDITDTNVASDKPKEQKETSEKDVSGGEGDVEEGEGTVFLM